MKRKEQDDIQVRMQAEYWQMNARRKQRARRDHQLKVLGDIVFHGVLLAGCVFMACVLVRIG